MKGRKWTNEELRILKEFYPAIGTIQTQKLLEKQLRIKRSPSSIKTKADSLGLQYEKVQSLAILDTKPNVPDRPLKVDITVQKSPLKPPTYGYGLTLSQPRRVEIPEDPEFDFPFITQLFDTESIFSRAVHKLTQAIFKFGFEIKSKNSLAAKYIENRFKQLEQLTSMSTLEFFMSIVANLIIYSNVFIIRKRTDSILSNAKPIKINGVELNPTVGLWVQNIEMVRFIQEDTGRILKYQIYRWGKKVKEITLHNMIHIYMNRKPGYKAGTPLVVSVIDDIRALRSIEQTIEILCYQNAVPLFHMKIGDKLVSPIVKPEEIEDAQVKFMDMQGYGLWVTDWRHSIEAIGAGGKALDLKEYANHFKARIISGLGLSPITSGDSSGANRSTADVQNKDFLNFAKTIQTIFIDSIETHIIDQWLMEGGFNPLDEKNKVTLSTIEIDLDDKIKKESHFLNLFTSNILDIDEAREKLGYSKMTDGQLKRTFHGLYTMGQAQQDLDGQKELASLGHEHNKEITKINFKNQQTSAEQGFERQKELTKINQAAQLKMQKAKATTGVPGGSAKKAASTKQAKPTKKQKAATNANKNKSNPTNQHGTKLSKSLPVNAGKNSLELLIQYLISNDIQNAFQEFSKMCADNSLEVPEENRQILFNEIIKIFLDISTTNDLDSVKSKILEIININTA